MTAGAIAACIGNPCDLCLVRMQADKTLPMAERRNYKHVFDALGRTIREEGTLTLWRGSLPTVLRAMSLNAGMMVSFDEAK
jgi:solute carrier family 25 oxoglutarate transporter 11